jgi:predicted RNA-binding Zn-ribbon protein involved in translation (DUF1610 family)
MITRGILVSVADTNASIDHVECSDCNESLAHSHSTTTREPCPRCGSLRRTIHVGTILSAKVEMHAKAEWKSGARKTGKPLRWGVTGDDLHRNSGRWSTVERVFDRIRDYYYEHISDKESGTVIKHCEEKLTEHRGHGDARRGRDRGQDGGSKGYDS